MNLLKYFLSLTLILGSYAQAWDQATSKVVQVDQASGVSSTPNYWKSGDAEVLLTGVAAYNDGASAKPVDCTGGSSTMTGVRNATNPMYDKQSWLITKPASNVQGQGIAFEFDVDNSIAAVEMMDLMFEYIVDSGTFAAGSDTTNSDLMVYVYDVTAGQLIEPKGGSKLYTSSTTLKGDYRGWFQSTLGSKKYRVCLHQATTSASAYTLKVDAGKVQKSKHVVGTIITDWQSWDPTLTFVSGSTSATITKNCKWRQVGDTGEYACDINFGAGTIGTWTAPAVTLPAGHVIDTVNGPASLTPSQSCRVTTVKSYIGLTSIPGSNLIGCRVNSVLTHTGTVPTPEADITSTFPEAFANGSNIRFNLRAKIQGWSAGARMSDGYDGRVIALNSIRANMPYPGVGNTLVFNSIQEDTVGGLDTSTGRYTFKASRYCSVDTRISLTHAGVNNQYLSVALYLNGTKIDASEGSVRVATSTTAVQGVTTPFARFFKAGEILDVRVSGTNITGLASGAGEYSSFRILCDNGTSSMSPTALWETHYAGTAGDAIGTSDSLIKFTTKVEDTFGSYNPATGLWTAKGPASCSAAGRVSSTVNLPTNQGYTGSIHKNGVRYVLCTRSNGTGVSANHSTVCANTSIKVNTGDTISINAVSDVATTAATAVESSYFTVSCR